MDGVLADDVLRQLSQIDISCHLKYDQCSSIVIVSEGCRVVSSRS